MIGKTPKENKIVEESPDVDCNVTRNEDRASYTCTGSTEKVSKRGTKVKDRAWKIGIVRNHPFEKDKKRMVDTHHPIFPLTSTLVDNSISRNENAKNQCFFDELCPATQVCRSGCPEKGSQFFRPFIIYY